MSCTLVPTRVMTRSPRVFTHASVEQPFSRSSLRRPTDDFWPAAAVGPVSNLSLIDWIDKANWPERSRRDHVRNRTSECVKARVFEAAILTTMIMQFIKMGTEKTTDMNRPCESKYCCLENTL